MTVSRALICAIVCVLTLAQCSEKKPVSVPVKVNDESLQIELFAAEPLIQQPIGITIDAAGRLLVIESHTHHRPADWKGPAHDQIVWLKDTDGDGKADAREIILGETDATMDIATAPDGSVYVSTRNEILRLSDQGPDGKPHKIQRKVVWLETANNYPHNGLASLAFDGHGGLLFGIGENYGAAYTLMGSDGKKISDQGEGGNIWHVTLDGKDLRRVATGFWNPFGIGFDSWGNVFATDNDPNSRPPCRLLHIVQGGDYGYLHRYGRSGRHPFISWDGSIPGTLPMAGITGEAPCDLMFYNPPPTPEFHGLSAQWRGSLLTPAWADNRVESYRLTPKDGTFTAERKILCQGGESFHPVAMAVAADGSMYLSDWVTRDYELRGLGRIWHLAAKKSSRLAASNVKPYPDDPDKDLREHILTGPLPSETEILSLLSSAKAFLRDAAIQRLSREPMLLESLSCRPQPSALEEAGVMLALRAAVTPEPGAQGPHINLPIEPAIQRALAHPSPEVKLVGLKWVADQRLTALKPAVETLLKASDLSSDLYYAAMTTIARIDSDDADELSLIKRLKQEITDPIVPVQRKIHALSILPDRTRNITGADVLPLLDEAKGEDKVWLVHFLGTLWEPQKTGVLNSVRSLFSANKVVTPAQRLLALARDDKADAKVRSAALVQASLEASDVEWLLKLALDDSAEAQVRLAALQALPGHTLNDTQKQALGTVKIPALKPAAARAAGQPFFSPQRPDPKNTAQWRAFLDGLGGKPEITNGRNVFMSIHLGGCAVCHRADGIGQQAGPNLATISNAASDYALESLLQPSRNVAPQFESFLITTRDGQTRMGFQIDQRGSRAYYVSIGGDTFFADAEDTVSRTTLTTSIMPEGLIAKLTDTEVRDLIAFLNKK